jgi:ABC-2 type transport system ATP-binding protein
MIIEARDLKKRYGRHDAVHGMDLSLPEGAALALIGPNGAGKTTTLRMLMNLIRPDGGEATLLGVDSRKLTPRHFEQIGYVSENQKLPKNLSIDQFFAYLSSIYPTWDEALAAELLDRFDLPGERRIGKLSHGMRLKTAMASALAFRPKLLVADEPLGGLDPLVRDELMSGLLSLAGEMSILISSHELSEIEGAATHVAFMDRGRLVFQESMEELLGRFREVTVVFGEGGKPPAEAPESWVNPHATSVTYSFIDTRFAGEQPLRATLAEKLGRFERLDIRPMPLREASKAMMREMRKEARA